MQECDPNHAHQRQRGGHCRPCNRRPRREMHRKRRKCGCGVNFSEVVLLICSRRPHAATHHTRSRHARRVRRPCCTRHDSYHRPRRHRRTRSAPSRAGRRPCRAAKAGHSRATLGVQRQRCRRAAHRRRLGREVRRHGCKGCHLRTGETEGGRQGTLEGRVLRAVSPTACGRSSGNTPPARSRARAPLSCHMHTAPSRVVIQRSGARIETSTRSRARARSA